MQMLEPALSSETPAATLWSQRLLFRPLALDDAPAIQRIFPQWEVVRYLPDDIPWPYPTDGARWFVERQALPAMARGEQYHWSIRLREGPGELMGVISLRPFENSDRQRGFWLDPTHQRQGYTYEAAERITAFAFGELGLDHLTLNNAEPNLGSARIKQKQGARLLGTEFADFVSGRLRKQVWRLDREAWLRR